jgi:hypothetical protein
MYLAATEHFQKVNFGRFFPYTLAKCLHFLGLHSLPSDRNERMQRERRKHFRVEWNFPATFHDLERDLVRPCILSNFSNSGAEITGVRAGTVPDVFMLQITREVNRTRKCRVIWRTDDTIGVEFMDCVTNSDLLVKKRKDAVG